jgi:hypothetical protein
MTPRHPRTVDHAAISHHIRPLAERLPQLRSRTVSTGNAATPFTEDEKQTMLAISHPNNLKPSPE